MTDTPPPAAPDARGRHSGPQDTDAPVSIRAASLDDVWCNRCGWVPLETAQRGGGGRRYCPTHVNSRLETHWGPCPRCLVQKVYRPSRDVPTPVCGACRGILRGRVASAASNQDQHAAVA